MSLFDKKILIVVFMTTACCFPLLVHAELSPKKVLDTVYGKYDEKHSCWRALVNDQRYCMKIDRADTLSSDTGQRLYLLLVGDAVDDQGEPNGAHVTNGLVGAFIVEEHNGQPVLVASDPTIQIGTFGSPPKGWRLVKLGPSDYWGWQNTAEDGGQGCFVSWHSILAPYGKTIRELMRFHTGFSDAGTCSKRSCTSTTSIESEIKVDSTRTNEKVFPLLITLTGEYKGKKLAPKTWTIPFDTTKWSYVEPKKWPLTGLEC